MDTTYTGSCLCGGVKFRIQGPLPPIQVCWCTQCRKAQGAPMATNMPIATSAFELTSGAGLLSAYESSPGKKRVFCGRCGAPIFSERDIVPDVVRIRAGLIDQPLDTRPVAHFHVATKPNWWPIHDGLPQFQEGQPGLP